MHGDDHDKVVLDPD
jgi:hypothetical protein